MSARRCCIVWILLDGVGDVACPVLSCSSSTTATRESRRSRGSMEHEALSLEQGENEEDSRHERHSVELDASSVNGGGGGKKTDGKRKSIGEDDKVEQHSQLLWLTPLQASHTPHLDAICAGGSVGLMDPVEPGLACGSDTAHLSLLGYDPRKWYRGRGEHIDNCNSDKYRGVETSTVVIQ